MTTRGRRSGTGRAAWAAAGVGVLLAAAGWAPASDAPLTFEEAEAFLAENAKARTASLADQAKALLAPLTAALASDAALVEAYRNVVEKEQFGGDRDRIQAWEDKNEDTWKTPEFLAALRLHAQYVAATLTKRAGDDEAAEALTLQWIGDAMRQWGRVKGLARQPLLADAVSKSLFLQTTPEVLTPRSRRMTAAPAPTLPPRRPAAGPELKPDALAGLLAGLSRWHLGPLTNPAEVHRVNIIGALRARRDPALFEAWRRNLNLEGELAEQSGLPSRLEAFATDRRPWILWQIGRDHALFGRPREAVSVMVAALRDSPRCADYGKIADDIRQIIANARQKTAEAPAPASAPPGPSAPAPAPAGQAGAP